MLYKKLSLMNFQNSQEDICAKVSFFYSVAGPESASSLIKKLFCRTPFVVFSS